MSRLTGFMNPMPADDLPQRNRRVVGVLLAIIAALITAALLVGIRWSR